MDSSGIAMLVSVAREGREVQLRNPSAIVRRLIELTGLAETFGITSLDPRVAYGRRLKQHLAQGDA